jgi:hypothetical protein
MDIEAHVSKRKKPSQLRQFMIAADGTLSDTADTSWLYLLYIPRLTSKFDMDSTTIWPPAQIVM